MQRFRRTETITITWDFYAYDEEDAKRLVHFRRGDLETDSSLAPSSLYRFTRSGGTDTVDVEHISTQVLDATTKPI